MAKDKNTLLPFAQPDENFESSESLAPNIDFPKTRAALSKLKKQRDEMVTLKRKAERIASRSGKETIADAYEDFSGKWANSISEIASSIENGRLEEAMCRAQDTPRFKAVLSLLSESPAEREASLISASLQLKTEALLIRRKLNANQEIDEEMLLHHRESCLSLPLDLEGEDGKKALVDESLFFLFSYDAKLCQERGEDFSTFLSCLSRWQKALGEEALSTETKEAKEKFFSALTNQYNAQCQKAFKKDYDYERSRSLFLFRDLFPKASLAVSPFRYAYDENEFKLYFYEAKALGKGDEEFSAFAKEIIGKIKTPNDFEFLALAHFLSLPGLSKERFAVMMSALKGLDFEKKIQLLASSLSLGVEPIRARDLIASIEKTHPKKLDLEACAKPLVFIQEHLNGPLRMRFEPILNDILRSPRAHKVVVKSNSIPLHVLAGATDKNPRLPLGKGMKKTKVTSWGIARQICYFLFGVSLPVVLLLFSAIFVYLYYGDSSPYASLYELAPLCGMLIFTLATLYAWMGLDERGASLTRTILLGDSLWKAALSAAYFIVPSSLPWISKVRYSLIAFALIEAFVSFLALKQTKKRALLDYILFGVSFSLSVLAVVYMIYDMMHGLV